MFQSLSASHLVLRFSLATVFMWFGIDKFVHPTYWINAWVPQVIVGLLEKISTTPHTFLVGLALFELLVGISLLSGMFVRAFAGAAVIFLLAVLITFGPTEVLVRDIGLIGGLVALILWPQRRSYQAW